MGSGGSWEEIERNRIGGGRKGERERLTCVGRGRRARHGQHHCGEGRAFQQEFDLSFAFTVQALSMCSRVRVRAGM